MFLLVMAKLESQQDSQKCYMPMPEDDSGIMFWWIPYIIVLNFNTVSWFNL